MSTSSSGSSSLYYDISSTSSISISFDDSDSEVSEKKIGVVEKLKNLFQKVKCRPAFRRFGRF